MKTILLAKHWKVFFITFLIPYLLIRIPFKIDMQSEYVYSTYILPMLRLLLFGIPLIWYWSIGKYLIPKYVQLTNIKYSRFKVYFLVTLIYCLIGLTSILIFSNMITPEFIKNNDNLIVTIILILTPIHIFSVYCGFYCIWILAKTLKTIQLKREVSFSDFITEFIILFVFPICIWILQPKINGYMISIENESTNAQQSAPIIAGKRVNLKA